MNPEISVPLSVMAAIRAPFEATGAVHIEPPVLQPLSLLLDLAGEVLRERLFVLQAEGGEALCLRPDFTIPIVRTHMALGKSGGRYRYEGSVFLVNGRGLDDPDEVRQIGLESFEASDPPVADADMAGLAWRSASAGGRDDLRLVFGDVGLFGGFLDALGLAEPLAGRLRRAFRQPRRLRAELDRAGEQTAQMQSSHLESLLTQMTEVEAGQVLQELWSLAGIQPVGGRPASEIVQRLAARSRSENAPSLSSEQAAQIERYIAIDAPPHEAIGAMTKLVGGGARALDSALGTWGERLTALEKQGVPADRMTLAAGFSRPFGYYDGVFFEVISEALGRDAPVAAGGRYDGLPSQLGAAERSGALGCMVRPARAWSGDER